MRSKRPPMRAATRNALPPNSSALISPRPSGAVSTVTSWPAARRSATWSRAYAPIPQCLGGYEETTRIFTPPARSQRLGAALHGDPHQTGVLGAAHDVERVVLLVQVVDGPRVAGVHSEGHEVAAVDEGQALQDELDPVLALE